MPPLYLMRHGETAWNVEGRMQGTLDSALTPLGRVQAARQGAILRAHAVEAPVFVSPRKRARATAAIAGLRGEVDEDLAEISMGAWEGQMRPVPGGGVLWKFDAPGAEAQAAFVARLTRVLERGKGPRILITHGVVCIGLRAILSGMSFGDWDRLDDPQGVVYRLDSNTEVCLR